MAEITLKQAQEQVDSWIKTYGVRYFNELTKYDHSDRKKSANWPASWPAHMVNNLSRRARNTAI